MRRLTLALVFALLPTVLLAQAPFYPKEWNTEGIKLNPSTSTTLCQYVLDSESTETHRFRFIVSSTAIGAMALEQVGSDGSTVLRVHVYAVAANSTMESSMLTITLNPNERVRVRPFAVFVGSAQCSLFVEA